MTKPVYKIETLTGAVSDYIITADAFNINYTDILTDGVGTFRFDLPTVKGVPNPYHYNDIALNDKVKIWLGYDTVGTNPNFVGKITDISGPLQIDQGYVRTISGLGVGEVLLRRVKTNTLYTAIMADALVDYIIEDLSAAPETLANDHTLRGTKVQAETIEVPCKTYFDLLQEISDYYVDGTANDVKFDFAVNTNLILRWMMRPWRDAPVDVVGTADDVGAPDTTTTHDAERTEANDYWNGCYITFTSGTNVGLTRLITDFVAATDTITHLAFPDTVEVGDAYSIEGVEALTVGSNILSYNVVKDINAVRNNIIVYGTADATMPRDKDSWTEADTVGWHLVQGEDIAAVPAGRVGVNGIRGHTGAASDKIEYYYDHPRMTTRHINQLNFWRYYPIGDVDTAQVRIYAPDSGNYFFANIKEGGGGAVWKFYELGLGPTNEYDVDKQPNGVWDTSGSPNWWDLEAVDFNFDCALVDQNCWVDGLYYSGDRWVGTASSLPSAHGQRDLEVIDDRFHSDAECIRRAETLLYQRKDAPTQLEVITPGNTNILIGDRISMTIPAETINAVPFDVIKVEHSLNNGGFTSRATMVYNPTTNVNTRQEVERTPVDMIWHDRRQQRRMYQHGYWQH